MFLPKRKAESRESSVVDKSKADFLNRVQTVKSEIRTKFLNLRKDLDDQELRALEKVEKIERDNLEKFEKASASLKEISQVREQVLTGLKSNATNKFLKKNLKMYDDEIKEIQNNFNIDSTIELVWKLKQLAKICEVSSSADPNSQASRILDFPSLSSKRLRISKPFPKVSMGKIPPVKISRQSTKNIPNLSLYPKNPLFKSSIPIDPDYDSESNSGSVPDLDLDPEYGSNSGSGPVPDPEYGSNSGSGPDLNPDYDHDYDPDHGYDPDPGYDPAPDHDYDPAPDHGYDPAPDHGYDPAPDHGYDPTPDHGYDPTPDHGYDPAPDHGYDAAPASDSYYDCGYD